MDFFILKMDFLGFDLFETHCDCCWRSVCLCPMSQELYSGVEEVFEATDGISSDDLYSLASSSFSNFTHIFDHIQVYIIPFENTVET